MHVNVLKSRSPHCRAKLVVDGPIQIASLAGEMLERGAGSVIIINQSSLTNLCEETLEGEPGRL
jgi:hypothetical protein